MKRVKKAKVMDNDDPFEITEDTADAATAAWLAEYEGRKLEAQKRMREAQERISVSRHRTATAYHEAGHAIAGKASSWYHGDYVELGPVDQPDLHGLYRSIGRPIAFEQPYQQMEIGVGGFIVNVAGWLAEWRLRGITSWEDDVYGFLGYEDENGQPDWESFFNSDDQSDTTEAIRWLTVAANVLGMKAPSKKMLREVKKLSLDTVIMYWGEIEDLARDLDKSGKVIDIDRYWSRGYLQATKELCLRWARHYGRNRPSVAALGVHWKHT